MSDTTLMNMECILVSQWMRDEALNWDRFDDTTLAAMYIIDMVEGLPEELRQAVAEHTSYEDMCDVFSRVRALR